MWRHQNCKEFLCIDGTSTENGVTHFTFNQNNGYENQEQKKTWHCQNEDEVYQLNVLLVRKPR